MSKKEDAAIASVVELLTELRHDLKAPLQGKYHARIEQALDALADVGIVADEPAVDEPTPASAKKKH